MRQEALKRGPMLISLPDGRCLGVEIFGDPGGFPIVYVHGFPGSRLEASLADDISRELGVCVLGVDRPGYGLSTPNPQGDLITFAKDVSFVVGKLNLKRFSLVGVSGGGPYALACALELQERLEGLTLVGSLGPPGCSVSEKMEMLNRVGLKLARKGPGFVSSLVRPLGFVARTWPRALVVMVALRASPEDRGLLLASSLGEVLSASFREAFRQKGAGPVRDLLVYSQTWNLDLKKLRVRVHIWHGRKDPLVPLEVGIWLKENLPFSVAVFPGREGHFSIFKRYLPEMIRALIPEKPLFK